MTSDPRVRRNYASRKYFAQERKKTIKSKNQLVNTLRNAIDQNFRPHVSNRLNA